MYEVGTNSLRIPCELTTKKWTSLANRTKVANCRTGVLLMKMALRRVF